MKDHYFDYFMAISLLVSQWYFVVCEMLLSWQPTRPAAQKRQMTGTNEPITKRQMIINSTVLALCQSFS